MVRQRVHEVVRGAGAAVQRLEPRLEDEVLRVPRPFERLILERVRASRKDVSLRLEQQAVRSAGRVIDTNLLAARVAARDEGVAPAAVDPVDVARPGAAGERAA